MMRINITLSGEYACGKTRATNAIKDALEIALPDKAYEVAWKHQVGNEVTERGVFTKEAEA